MGHVQMDWIAAGLVLSLGIVYLVRRPERSLPLPVEFIRRIAAVYLALFKNFRIVDADHIPASGPVIFVANHTASYDPLCLQVACRDRWIRFMEAREYYDQKLLRTVYRLLRVIPVNRTGNDTASIRTAVRELSNDGSIGIFPEGRISDDCQIHEARQGVALLALLTNAAVVPAYIQGTRPFSGMVRDFLRFNRVCIHFGLPIRLDDLAAQHRDKESREIALQRIMNAITDLKIKADAGDSQAKSLVSEKGGSRGQQIHCK